MSANDIPKSFKKAFNEVEFLMQELQRAPSDEVCSQLLIAADKLIEIIPAEHPIHGNAIIIFCSSMALLWKLTHDEKFWQHGIDVVSYWCKTTENDWRNPVYTLAYGLMLHERAQTEEDIEMIDEAINVLQWAFNSVLNEAFVARTSSLPLANLFIIRYKKADDLADLESAIAYSQFKINIGNETDPDRYYAVKIFGQASLERYELKKDVRDLANAIVSVQSAVDISRDNNLRGDVEMLLGSAYRRLYEYTADEEDINKAIQNHEASLQHADGKDPELLAARSDNLANALAARYYQTRKNGDIERAVGLHQTALDQLGPKSPFRIKALRNYGADLVDLGLELRQVSLLIKALAFLREGLSLANEKGNTDEEILLSANIARMLLILDALNGTHDHLDETIDILERAYETSSKANTITTEVTFRLAEKEKTIRIVELLTGALICRAQNGGRQAVDDITRALVYGEASKSSMLANEVMRRFIRSPSSIPQNLIDWEGMVLARLSGLDSIHLRNEKVTLARKRRQMKQRYELVSSLENTWREIEATGHDGISYVKLRKSPHEAIIQLLGSSRGKTACLSLLDTLFPDKDGQIERRLAVIVLWPSTSHPNLLFWLPNDPLPEVLEQLWIRIQEYELANSWFESISMPLLSEIPDSIGCAAISPTKLGQNIPWHFVLQKAKWIRQDNGPLPIVLVPGLAMLLLEDCSGSSWYNDIDYDEGLPDELTKLEDKDAIQIVKIMPTQASTGPLIVGNPSLDLPDAEVEAMKIGDILNVSALIGKTASIAAFRKALNSANLIHLAAHAVFDPTSPLDSYIKLSDGELSMRDLFGIWSTAELVVLSACESGSGQPLTGGEVSSLATSLLRTGVRSVVASLWNVDDAATAFLMINFYTALQASHNVPEALASAMDIVRNQPGWDDPYYWAGFVAFQRGMGD